VTAAMQGFVYEVWMMVATIAAITIAVWQYARVEPWLGWVHSPAARGLAAFLLVAGAVLLAGALLGRLVRGMLRATGLRGIDRLLGAGLGLARGLMMGAVLVFLLTAYPMHRGWVAGSRLAPGFMSGSRALAALVPQALANRFEKGLQQVAPSGWTALNGQARWQ